MPPGIQQHAGALTALAIIAVMTLVLTLHGMKDETLLAILATGAVGIANAIAGVKTTPPGTTVTTTASSNGSSEPALGPGAKP